jgi:hypothetical protein
MGRPRGVGEPVRAAHCACRGPLGRGTVKPPYYIGLVGRPVAVGPHGDHFRRPGIHFDVVRLPQLRQ